MKYISTRGQSPAVSFGQALAQGLAPDGGLYLPEAWPVIPLSAFDGATTLPEIAEIMLRPFVEGDPIAPGIGAVVRDAFNFPAPLECVEAVAASIGKPFDEGMALERASFMALMQSPESRALRHMFVEGNGRDYPDHLRRQLKDTMQGCGIIN